MNINYQMGDLLHSGEFVIAHGCNTQGLMGAGIAKQVRDQFPAAYSAYTAACRSKAFTVGTAQRVCVDPNGNRPNVIYNLGTQQNPGRDATTWGIFLSFANMFESMRRHDEHRSRVAIPRIGAGIGGLNWTDDVLPAINEAQERVSKSRLDFSVVVYDYTP